MASAKLKTILAFVALFLAIIFIAWQRQSPYPTGTPGSVPAEVKSANPTAIEQASVKQVSAGAVTAVPEPTQATPLPGAPSAQDLPSAGAPFQQWIRDQAKVMDQPHVNEGELKRQMGHVVQSLSPEQSVQLLQTARSGTAPASEKILSTYLLVQAGARARKELSELIASPLPVNQNFQPHSVDEAKSVREKTLRIMAVDGLASQAERDPEARLALAQGIDRIRDPYVRAYAEDRLRRLPPQ